MPDRSAFRFAASLLFAGIVFSLIAGMFHPDREPANNHAAVFGEYASSASWTAVHLGQFVGMAIIVAGLLGFFFPLSGTAGQIGWVKRFGVVSAIVALALYGVLQAVDGGALRMPAVTSESGFRLGACDDLTRVWGFRRVTLRQYAGLDDRQASDSAKMGVGWLEAR